MGMGDREWARNYEMGTPLANEQRAPNTGMYAKALTHLDINALTDDIKKAMYDSHPVWPADFQGFEGAEDGNYGPQFIRLAWHCSGSYRLSDGKGGCTGGKHRFEPERSWDDNTNLDKTRALLAPIKAKYGDALSWGDLIIAAGTTALREMGTPIQQLCLGRQDESDGTNSLDLGKNGQPKSAVPACEVQGMCKDPVGASTVGLIYVNPEGPVVEAGGSPVPDPALSAVDIRDVFSRMGQDDRATVALIGGGHAFGKCHGACDTPQAQGLSPFEAYAQNLDMAYEGKCGEGEMKGVGYNTFTAGFEGPWTTQPTQWTNEFFTSLLDREWEKFIGPGGHYQWRIKNATGAESGLMRLTSDIALISDDKYKALVEEFASDIGALAEAFDSAWFMLTHRGGTWSPHSRCDVGEMPAWIMDAPNNRMLDSDVVV